MPILSVRRTLAALAVGLFAYAAGAGGEPYRFGVFPYLPVTKIHDLYEPMAADFGAKLGKPVQLSSKARYEAFEDELRRETYDIAFIQPFVYVEAHDRHGYLPVARRPGDLEALIVVRADSSVTALADLKGKIVANPPVDAAVSHLTSMALLVAGIDPKSGVRRHYGRNHFSCLQSVLIGAADACGLAEQAFHTVEKQQGKPTAFRIVHRTARIPRPLFVVHKRVPKAHRNALRKTIVDWPKTQEGKRILKEGQFAPFVPTRDAEYEVVREYLRSRK